MFLWKLAVRNLFRNVWRSLLTITTIVVGIFSLVSASGMVEGVEFSLTGTEIRTESGHLRVFRKGYLKEEENYPLDITVDRPQKVIQALQKRWPKAVVFSRIIFSAKLSDGFHRLNVRGVVCSGEKQEQAFGFSSKSATKKSMPEKKGVVVLGATLAETMKKKVGDTVTLEARTQSGSINAIDVKIVNLLATGNPFVDANTIFLPRKTGVDFLRMSKDVTDILAVFPNRRDSEKAAALLRAQNSKNFPMTWQEKAKEVEGLNNTRRKMFNFLIGMLLLIAAAGLANTMLMSGYERKGEIGMMMAMGMRRARIVRMFAAEASLLGLVGSLIGVLLGAWLVLHFQKYGIDISQNNKATGGTSTMTLTDTLYFQLKPMVLFVGLFLGIGVSVLASILPATRLTKMEPRETLTGS